MVPLLQITFVSFKEMKMGWGELYAGMDGDEDDLATSCGDRGGDGY